ncbi:MAG TPA: hypothetical protein VGJ60_11205 [Chloroflexota bacterium]|jgi:hypothetical protein
MQTAPALEVREKKTQRLLLCFTPTEFQRLLDWSRAGEREPEQAIRWLLRDILQGVEAVA